MKDSNVITATRDGTRMVVRHSDSLLKSGQQAFVMAAFASIVRAGHGDARDWVMSHDNGIVWAEVRGATVGCMTYKWQDWNDKMFINISFVSEGLRRQGVYMKMNARLREIAIERGAIEMMGGIDVDNAAMRACAERCGRVATGILYSERIPPKKEDSS